jgi:phosphomannomutase
MINPKIFKKFDVRGKYPQELDENSVFQIACAFIEMAGLDEVVIGYDYRLSSPSLADAVREAIVSQGATVIDIGQVSSGQFYFALRHYNYQSGLMITASHMEKEFNGIKPDFNERPLKEADIFKWKELALNKQFTSKEKLGQVKSKNILDDYYNKVKSLIKKELPMLKVVMDAGNAMAGPSVLRLYKDSKVNAIFQFCDINPNCPNHEVNPKKPENRSLLKKRILEENADLGFMWDGDADRFYVLDKNGEVFDPNFVTALISRFLVKNESKRKQIVIDVRTSVRLIKDMIEPYDGRVKVIPAWHVETKIEMNNNPKAIFGSETSGHYVYADFYNIDDGLVASLLFLQAAADLKEPINEWLEKMKKNYFIKEEVNFKFDERSMINKAYQTLEDRLNGENVTIDYIDGLTMKAPNWRFNIRPSASEPLFRLNVEGNEKKHLEFIYQSIRQVVEDELGMIHWEKLK